MKPKQSLHSSGTQLYLRCVVGGHFSQNRWNFSFLFQPVSVLRTFQSKQVKFYVAFCSKLFLFWEHFSHNRSSCLLTFYLFQFWAHFSQHSKQILIWNRSLVWNVGSQVGFEKRFNLKLRTNITLDSCLESWANWIKTEVFQTMFISNWHFKRPDTDTLSTFVWPLSVENRNDTSMF